MEKKDTAKTSWVSVTRGAEHTKKMGGEFKKFITRGNVMDLAVAVIIGGAFGKIVTSFVNDMLMPFIVLLTGQQSLAALSVTLRAAEGEGEALLWKYGSFLQSIIDFLIVALAIFLLVRILSKFKKKEEAAPPAPPDPSAEERLLTEIRDELRARGGK